MDPKATQTPGNARFKMQQIDEAKRMRPCITAARRPPEVRTCVCVVVCQTRGLQTEEGEGGNNNAWVLMKRHGVFVVIFGRPGTLVSPALWDVIVGTAQSRTATRHAGTRGFGR